MDPTFWIAVSAVAAGITAFGSPKWLPAVVTRLHRSGRIIERLDRIEEVLTGSDDPLDPRPGIIKDLAEVKLVVATYRPNGGNSDLPGDLLLKIAKQLGVLEGQTGGGGADEG